jgi:NADH-quinone oxidoreductase subunit L
MVWYKPFFGDSAYVAKFFGIPEAVAEAHDEAATDDHAAATEEAAPEGATTEGAATEAAATEQAATEEADHGETAMAEADHGAEGEGHHFAFGGAPGDGGIYIGPDNHVLDEAHAAPTWVKVSPFFAMLLGFLVAFQFYIRRPDLPGKLAENQRPLYLFLLNKWYFDEIFDFVFVRPTLALGRLLWKRGDGDAIDGSINGVAMGLVPMLTRLAGRAQSGYIFTYAFAMVIGIAVILTWVTLSGGAN